MVRVFDRSATLEAVLATWRRRDDPYVLPPVERWTPDTGCGCDGSVGACGCSGEEVPGIARAGQGGCAERGVQGLELPPDHPPRDLRFSVGRGGGSDFPGGRLPWDWITPGLGIGPQLVLERAGPTAEPMPGPPRGALEPPCGLSVPCIVPLCDTLEPPPFEEAAAQTQQCFVDTYGTEGWPTIPVWCLGPCEEQRDCVLPTEEERLAVWDTVWILTLSQEYLEYSHKFDDEDEDPCNDWIPLETVTDDERAFVESAIALLLANADLAQWAACLTVAWSAEDSGPESGGTLKECLEDYLTAQTPWSVYLIDGFWAYENEICQDLHWDGYEVDWGPTGVASGLLRGDVGPDGRTGVVLPLHHDFWVDQLGIFLSGTPEEALCAVLNLAGVILHELVHLCEADTNSDCLPDEVAPDLCCWEEQRMIQSMFEWAMVQRYPCLAGVCPAGDECRFANSGFAAGVPTCP